MRLGPFAALALLAAAGCSSSTGEAAPPAAPQETPRGTLAAACATAWPAVPRAAVPSDRALEEFRADMSGLIAAGDAEVLDALQPIRDAAVKLARADQGEDFTTAWGTWNQAIGDLKDTCRSA